MRGLTVPGNVNHPSETPTCIIAWNAALSGDAPPAQFPFTMIMRTRTRAAQDGYWSHFFHANNFAWGQFNSAIANYFGGHPYPDPPLTGPEKHEITGAELDTLGDLVTFGSWRWEVFRTSASRLLRYHWNWPNTSNLIQVQDTNRGNPPDPGIFLLDAPWNFGMERCNSDITHVIICSGELSDSEVDAAIANPLAAANLWAALVEPTPSDISDKSGLGHHPVFFVPVDNVPGLNRPLLYADSGIIPAELTPGSSTSNATSYTSPVTYTFEAGRLYLIGIVHSDAASEADPVSVETTGGALAFVKVDSQPFNSVASNIHRLSLWRLVPGSTVSDTLRISLADAGTGCAWAIREYQGINTVTPLGTPVKAGVNGAASISASPGALQSAESIMAAFAAHDLNVRTDKPSGGGWAEVHDGVGYATPNTSLEWAENYAGAANQVTFSGAGSADRAVIAVEIRAAATVTPLEQDVALARRMLARRHNRLVLTAEDFTMPAPVVPPPFGESIPRQQRSPGKWRRF